jgi:hypothetical protein
MPTTVHLSTPIDGAQRLECESATVSEGLLTADLADSDRVVVVPLSNVAGVEGADVDQEINTYPMQGGQYTEFVSRIR